MVKFIVSILLGASIAFGLFVIMAKLVQNDGKAQESLPPPPVIDIVMQKPDDEIQTRVRKPPPPPPPPQEPPKVELVEPAQADPNSSGFSLSIPSVDTGGISNAVGGIGGMRDGDAAPIVRIPPDYPPQAARDGKEGWVRLSFTINEVGGVEDVEVLDADPKRIFDRNAKRALRKWKYRPQIVDGVAQKQFGLEVQLDFKLGE
ncbi:MAG: protein TonB [Glaciecola sp.]|jgi:protein TonB|nr:energy transducer TonB [uncultured Glaciecola sp.]